MTNHEVAFDELESKIGREWTAIRKARELAKDHVERIRRAIGETQSNSSAVAFGSLARGEWTFGSDVDWTLLIDGPSSMDSFNEANRIESKFQELGYKKPGRTATFGTMSSGHELVHHIGGEEDTNHNLTRRILLLLESVPLSDEITYNRVVRSVLERYIFSDQPVSGHQKFRAPLFLLNDVVRFWRTMAVDYASKKWQRQDAGWALRNIKLRFSRKLLFAKGLLMCFLCHSDFAGEPEENATLDVNAQLQLRCEEFVATTPVNLIAFAVLNYTNKSTANKIFDSYDYFLATCDDKEKRDKLEKMSFDERKGSPLFEELRDCSNQFRDGLTELFFDSNLSLTDLTKQYGVF